MMMTEQLTEQKLVFFFQNTKRVFDDNGDDCYSTETIRILDLHNGYSRWYELRINGTASCRIGSSAEVLEGLKRILCGLNWNYEYRGDFVLKENRWELKADLPGLKFRTKGYNGFPQDYNQTRDAILREVMGLFWKYSGLQEMAAFDGNGSLVLAGEYTVYQARNDRYDKYYFYYDDQQLGTAVSQNAANFPVQIQGEGLDLRMEMVNRYPIFYRLILRDTPVGPVAEGRLERVKPNEYHLWIGSECIRVSTYDQTSCFYRGQREIARLTKADDNDREYFILRSKVRMEYYMTVREELPRKLALLLLSFPCLNTML